jgi:Na+/proline symporter
MLGIGVMDWAALAIYFVGITFVGIWAGRKVKDRADFFMAGRQFGRTFMVFFAFGAGTSGNDAVGVSAKTYTSGLSGIWYQWLWLFCTPFYWIIAPVFRRMRAITTGDYFEARYDGSVGALYSIMGVLVLTFNIGVIQLGAGSMIEAVTGGALQKEYAILGMTCIFVVYGMVGGLAAAIVTDFIQGILTVFLSFILLPFALYKVGGFDGLKTAIADPHMFSLVAPGEINFFFIAVLCANALIGIVTQPHIMGVCAAGRTELDGRVGFAYGNLLKRFCTVAWTVTGLCGVVMYAGTDIKPDMIYGQVAGDLLPAVMPGLIGIFLAGLIASMMSSCDAFMVSSSGLFTQNFYHRYVVKGASEKHYVMVGRIASLVIVVVGVSCALIVPNVTVGLEWFFKLQAIMGAAFWLGLFWRRTTVAGAWAATLVTGGIIIITNLPSFNVWAVQNLPEYMIWDNKFRVSWQMFTYLTVGFSTGILVSLVTPRVPKAKLDKVYECLATPVSTDEPHGEAFTLPPGVQALAPRKLINHPDLEIYTPSAESVRGFLILCGWVVALIAFVFWMSTWGTPATA